MVESVPQDYVKSLIENIEWNRYANFVPKVINEEVEEEATSPITENSEAEVVEEETSESDESCVTCPLCESVLEEEVSEERLAEHITEILEAAKNLLDEDTEE